MFHHHYKSAFWGIAYGFEKMDKYNQWFIQFGRHVWVFRNN